jgi:hypothetical protein
LSDPDLGPDAEANLQDTRPRYRKLAGLAVGGALLSAAICVLLVRGAHQTPPSEPDLALGTTQPANQAPVGPKPLPVHGTGPDVKTVHPGWAVVGAAYRRRADAEKRAAEIRKRHPALDPRVDAADPNGRRFMVLFGTGLTEAQAKRQLGQIRRLGGPGDAYITRFR